MQISGEQLSGQLKRGLLPLYFISGDEPLLIEDCVQAILVAAASAGFGEREVVNVESGFDWNAFYVSLQSGSLFSNRRLIELRLPTGRPGEAGGKLLAELAQSPSSEITLIVRTGKLDKAARATKWVKALEGAGVAVTVYPLESAQLPRWIERRMRAVGLIPGPGVVELLAYYTEGNLLAGAQEIEKLVLHFGTGDVQGRTSVGRSQHPASRDTGASLHGAGDRVSREAANARPGKVGPGFERDMDSAATKSGATEIGLDDIEGVLGDNARYSVYALADACLRAAHAEIVRILRTLHTEGEAPALVSWALAREIRMLARLAAEVAAGTGLEQVLDAHRNLVWAKRRVLVAQALKRGDVRFWRGLLQQAARTDRIVKGRAQGEAWQTLECLALAMGGTRLVSCI